VPSHFTLPRSACPARARGTRTHKRRPIAPLIRAGADPNAVDNSGVAPLHRAVRTRCAAAVRALLDGGADVRRKNKSGSTPMLLATQNTGRGGTGSPEAKAQQDKIVRLLEQHNVAEQLLSGIGSTMRPCSAGWPFCRITRLGSVAYRADHRNPRDGCGHAGRRGFGVQGTAGDPEALMTRRHPR
jgi:hypothetical protein